MKTQILLVLASATVWNAEAAASAIENQAVVYLENQITPREEFQARGLATRMFADAGVRIVWRQGRPSGAAAAEHPIVVSFTTNEPETEHPGALAYARPYEHTHIEVFYDRISKGYPKAHVVLAHVLVHEITHILQGIARHSDSGVMKAHWSPGDYTAMMWRPLPFTQDDIDLIRAGLKQRAR